MASKRTEKNTLAYSAEVKCIVRLSSSVGDTGWLSMLKFDRRYKPLFKEDKPREEAYISAWEGGVI